MRIKRSRGHSKRLNEQRKRIRRVRTQYLQKMAGRKPTDSQYFFDIHMKFINYLIFETYKDYV